MFKRLEDFFKTAKLIYLTLGWIGFVRWGWRELSLRIYLRETYFLYELATENIAKLKQSEFEPLIESYTLKVFSSNQDVQDLRSEGICIQPWYPHYSQRLNDGAVAFCILVGHEIAHMGWIAMSKKAIGKGHPPLAADFKNNEAVTFGTWTSPKYRRNKLSTFGVFKRLEYFKKKGVVLHRSVAAKKNVSSSKVAHRFGYKTYGEGRLLKILWWRWWKEEPLQGRN